MEEAIEESIEEAIEEGIEEAMGEAIEEGIEEAGVCSVKCQMGKMIKLYNIQMKNKCIIGINNNKFRNNCIIYIFIFSNSYVIIKLISSLYQLIIVFSDINDQ